MANRTFALLGSLLCCIALLSCTVSPSPSQSGPTTTTTESIPTTSNGVTLPPRPREVRLDRVNPCTLLTAKQRKALGFDRPPIPDTSPGLGNAKACDFRDSTRALTVRLSAVLIQGAEVWLDETAQADARLVTVVGFPALEVRTPEQTKFCNVEVDVAAGQFLDVQFGDAGNIYPPPLDELCANAHRVAEAAVMTVTR